MKYVYFVGAALCAILGTCAILTMAGVLELELGIKEAGVGVIGATLGTYLGLQLHKAENDDELPPFIRM